MTLNKNMLALAAVVVVFLGYYILSSGRTSNVNENTNKIEQKDIKVLEEMPLVEQNKNALDEKKSLALLVESINNLKQGTFEATKEFKKRHLVKMSELQDSTKFYAQKGLEDYSAGVSTMESYNPDTEVMTLSLNWNNELKKMLPELETIDTVYTYIARAEAKKLFEKKKKHFFHIELDYTDKKLNISKISAYDKYIFYENLNDAKKSTSKKTIIKKPSIVKNAEKKKIVKKEISNKTINKEHACNFYYCKTDALNVREKASSTSKKISKIRHNEKVCIIEKTKGWSHIKGTGWVLSKYLSKRKQKKPLAIIKKPSPYFWHCDAASATTQVWAEHQDRQSAIDNALYKCDRMNRSYQQCQIIRCY